MNPQMVCGIAYDNTRNVRKRWAGQRNPNGDDVTPWRRDHSNGDYASPQHCWRIMMQAPPSFVTDPTGTSTPFPKEWVTKYGSTTGQSSSELYVNVAVNGSRSITFIAQDPNTRDRITIFIMEIPGVPRGMDVGQSVCVPRTNVMPMCVGTDVMDAAYPNVNLKSRIDSQRTSACSRAQLTLSWTPPLQEAGRAYRVCAVARDDSAMCAGIANDATDRGWFGERQCVNFNVVAPVIRWKWSYEEGFGARDAFVGCEMKFVARAQDVSCKCVSMFVACKYVLFCVFLFVCMCTMSGHNAQDVSCSAGACVDVGDVQVWVVLFCVCLLACTCIMTRHYTSSVRMQTHKHVHISCTCILRQQASYVHRHKIYASPSSIHTCNTCNSIPIHTYSGDESHVFFALLQLSRSMPAWQGGRWQLQYRDWCQGRHA
jgi:hypothetical protein